jgi:hypothetical protein
LTTIRAAGAGSLQFLPNSTYCILKKKQAFQESKRTQI